MQKYKMNKNWKNVENTQEHIKISNIFESKHKIYKKWRKPTNLFKNILRNRYENTWQIQKTFCCCHGAPTMNYHYNLGPRRGISTVEVAVSTVEVAVSFVEVVISTVEVVISTVAMAPPAMVNRCSIHKR